MATPGKEQGMFEVTATPRRGGGYVVPVSPTNPDLKPTSPLSPKPEKRSESLKKHLSKKALIGRLAGALFIIMNAGAAIKYHYDFDTPNSPSGILQDIKGIPMEYPYTILKWQKDRTINDRLSQPVSPNYDKAADAQLVQAGVNATPVSKEELPFLLKDSIQPVEKDQFPKVSILLPLKFKNGGKAEIQTHWVEKAFNPISPESNEPVAYGKIITIAQKGTEIIVPLGDARVSFGTTIVQGKPYVSSYVIIFFGPDKTEYNLVMRTPDDIRQLNPTDSIKNALAEGKSNLDLSIDSSIAVTSSNNVEMTADMFAYPPGYSKNKRGIPVNYDFVEKQENGRATIAFLPRMSD